MAKNLLQEHFQKIKRQLPPYQTTKLNTKNGALWRSQLTIGKEILDSKDETFISDTFPRKVDAEQNVAAKVLKYINEHPVQVKSQGKDLTLIFVWLDLDCCAWALDELLRRSDIGRFTVKGFASAMYNKSSINLPKTFTIEKATSMNKDMTDYLLIYDLIKNLFVEKIEEGKYILITKDGSLTNLITLAKEKHNIELLLINEKDKLAVI